MLWFRLVGEGVFGKGLFVLKIDVIIGVFFGIILVEGLSWYEEYRVKKEERSWVFDDFM